MTYKFILFIINTFKLDELKYFFINEQLYKIIEKKKIKTKIVEILPKLIENTNVLNKSGICKIYYDIDNIDYKDAFYISNKNMNGINWLDKRDELYLKNNKFVFETYKLYDKIFYNKISCIKN